MLPGIDLVLVSNYTWYVMNGFPTFLYMRFIAFLDKTLFHTNKFRLLMQQKAVGARWTARFVLHKLEDSRKSAVTGVLG